MLSGEIRFLMQGREVSVDSFLEAIVREVRASVREEIGRTLPKREQQGSDSPRKVDSEIPRQAVSVREAARLLSISPRCDTQKIPSGSFQRQCNIVTS